MKHKKTIIVLLIMGTLIFRLPFILSVGSIYLVYKIYEHLYYKSNKFNDIKERISDYVQKCNELNEHIEELKTENLILQKTNYGTAKVIDTSNYNYKRAEQNKAKKSEFIYDCSLSVLKNASNQPLKYLCKYFNIKPNEENLSKFEKMLNDFSAIEEGKNILKIEIENIRTSIDEDIPFIIKKFSKKLMSNLGFKEVDFSTMYFPTYIFRYVSAGGNSSQHCSITLDIHNLEEFVSYLSNLVKFKKSVQGQRALMTPKLREHIKERDNYTCKCCGVSLEDEPHLLLEIDHIVPLSKGGMTTEDNLQTLCWKCNRSKGSKLEC